MMNSSTLEPATHLRRLLAKFQTAMLVTHADGGELRARPMAIARTEDCCRIWFFSGNDSGKIHEIGSDAQVSVVCQRDESIYLSLSGTASVCRDRDKIADLWNEAFRPWFPKGKDDPDLSLIVVEPEDGEYWDNEGFNKIKYLFETAKAYAAGERPAVEEGSQHAKVAW